MSTPRISPPEQLVTNGLIDALRTALGATKVGDHAVPDSHSGSYVIVYHLDGGRRAGSLQEPTEDAALAYQASCVGGSRMQAQWLADKVRNLVPELTITLVDWVVCDKIADVTPSGVQVEGKTKQDRLFTVPQRFTLYVTPE